MIKKRYYVKRQDLCLYIFWILLMACKGFAFNSFDQQTQMVVMLVAPFAIVKILLSPWNKQELLRSICLGCLGIAIWVCSGKTDTLITIIIIMVCKNADIYKMFKIGFWVRSVFFVSKVSSALLGFSEMQQVFNTRGVVDRRFALGYGHPNTAHYELFVIVVLAILIWHERMKMSHYLFLCGSNLFLYYYTRSRTGVIVILFVLFMSYEIGKEKNGLFKRIVAACSEYAYPVSAAFSILICLLLEWLPLFRSLGTFSSRFFGGQRALHDVPLSLFGRPISGLLDMGLINMLLGRGVVFFVLFLYWMSRLLKLFCMRGMYVEATVGITYAIYSLMENANNTIMRNVILLFLVWIIYPSDSAAWKHGLSDASSISHNSWEQGNYA